MRYSIAAAAIALIAVPAAAQSPLDRPATAAEAADRLGDPVVQHAAAAMVSALAGIVLDTRIGPLARLADPRADIRPNDTLRDLKRRDDPHFEARLHDEARRGVARAGAVAGDMVVMSGELRRTADRLRDALAPLAALAGDAIGRDDDY